jgi:hypothetical protein
MLVQDPPIKGKIYTIFVTIATRILIKGKSKMMSINYKLFIEIKLILSPWEKWKGAKFRPQRKSGISLSFIIHYKYKKQYFDTNTVVLSSMCLNGTMYIYKHHKLTYFFLFFFNSLLKMLIKHCQCLSLARHPDIQVVGS